MKTMANYLLYLIIVFVFQITLFAECNGSENLFEIEADSRKVEQRLLSFITFKNQLHGQGIN